MKASRRPEAAPEAPVAPRSAPLGPDAWIAVGLGLAYLVLYLAIALRRMSFPFELEWMEGASIGHVDRLLHGLPLYAKPSLDFTPFIYPPLYFVVSSWVAKLTGNGFLPLRLVSFAASLACFALIYTLVRRESSSRIPALLAVGLFAASYRQGGAWLDLGRVDTLFLALLLGSLLALRSIASPWTGGLAGGALLALAALTKQSAAFVAVPALVALLATDWRRGIALALGFGAVFGGAVALLDARSSGWFRFYVFELPRRHPIIGQRLRGFWIEDLLGPFAIALALGASWFFAAPVRPRLRGLTLMGAAVAGLIAAGYLTWIRVGSYVNVVMPAYLGVALLFGFGLAALFALRDPERPAARRAEHFVALLVITQFVVLAYKPWQQIPSSKDVEAGRGVVESLRRVEGDVWVPRHPYLAAMAGKPWHAHELALQDVLRRTEMPQQHALLDELNEAARTRRFALLVLDDQTWVHDTFAPTYTLAAKMFRDDEGELFWPKTGYVTRPNMVYVPARDTVAGRLR